MQVFKYSERKHVPPVEKSGGTAFPPLVLLLLLLTVRHQVTMGLCWDLAIPYRQTAIAMATDELFTFVMPADGPQSLSQKMTTSSYCL